MLITRAKEQAQSFAQQVEQHGGTPVIADVLRINCTGKDAVKSLPLTDIDWIFFTSANGVDCFISNLEERQREQLSHVQIAVVGSKTEKALARHGYTAAFTPSVFNAKTMGKEFLEQYPYPGKLLLVRGSKARPELVEAFTAAGCSFELMEVYRTETNKTIKESLDLMLQERIDYVTFTSPSAVDAFCELTSQVSIPDTKVVCIGTTTAKRAEEQGFDPANLLVPDMFTIEGMIHLINADVEQGGVNHE